MIEILFLFALGASLLGVFGWVFQSVAVGFVALVFVMLCLYVIGG
jgi:hypothetical protein